MQVRKVAVVATGALATAAAMGSTPAFAADNEGTQGVAPAAVGLLDYEGKHRASDETMRQVAEQWLTVAPEGLWAAPWDYEPPQILSVGSGSAASLAPWQLCGASAVAGVGGTVPVASPNTALDDCANGNLAVSGDGEDALFSVLDNSAISALSWQICGSSVVAGVGGTVPLASPNTSGGCDNGNISVDEGGPSEGMDGNGGNGEQPGNGYDYHKPGDGANGDGANGGDAYGDGANGGDGYGDGANGDGYGDGANGDGANGGAEPPAYYVADTADAAAGAEGRAVVEQLTEQAPWNYEAPQILSAGSGSAASAASWQFCGSTSVAGVGGSAPVGSPNTVLGDCTNGNIDVTGDGEDALFSLLDNTALSAASWQACGSSLVAGVGGVLPIASPNTVTGGCSNGNLSVSEG